MINLTRLGPSVLKGYMPDFDAQDLGVGAMRTSRYQADTMILAA
jgi:hypothetical protein